MSIVTVAVVIVAAFVAAAVRYASHRYDVRDAVSFGLSLLLFGLIVAAGPKVLGG